ncbi:DUF5069 domain-containing protein [Haloferula chungangensis]|uniref:DUF5069 domain-containing protein n=1 Tax=Haloferula chungangensis TaxID=1048331 RepID=A0ABW2L7R7_9BACT
MSDSNLKSLALDLASGEFPRSPRETLGGYVVAARTLDKCRAVLAGTNGEYHFDCPLDGFFLSFTGISADDFKAFVATGADDEAVAKWINENAKSRERRDIIKWNNEMRCKHISEMPIELQEFLEDYIPECIPAGKIVYVWFDVYDIEEGRI